MVTNRDLLVAVLRDEAFLAGQVSTDFFERTLGRSSRARRAAPTRTCCSPRPWRSPSTTGSAGGCSRGSRSAWRNVVSQPQRTDVRRRTGEEHVVEWYGGRDGYRSTDPDVRVLSRLAATRSCSRSDGVIDALRRHATRGHKSGAPPGATAMCHVDGGLVSARLREVPRFVDPADAVASGSLLAPMPGTVVRRGRRGRAPRSTAGQTGPRPRGDEDAAHDQRAGRRRGHRPRVAVGHPGGGRRRARRRDSSTDADEENEHEQLHRVRGAPDPAQGGGQARRRRTAGSTSPARPAAARRPPTCGWRSARPATSASTSPRSTAAGAAASATSRRSARSSPPRAARC